MTLGNRIAFFRKQQGLTQEALAQKLDVTNQAVSKWESDACCPDIQLLPKLADIFGISLDDLFGRESQAAPSQLPWENDGTLRVVLYIGHSLVGSHPAAEDLQFCYEGPALNIHSQISITCGEVNGNVTANGSVTCDDVNGNVQAGGNVACDDVDGDVQAGGSVTCDDVDGNVEAGGNVTCDSIDGDVNAGGNVRCDEINGSTIHANGGVYCDHFE